MKTLIKSPSLGVKLRSNTMLTTIAAAAVAMGSITPAYAAMVNTVIVNGNGPDGNPVYLPGDEPEATESVDLVDDAAELSIVKTATLIDGDGDGLGDAGETITYSYVVTNEGNTTLTDVGVNDNHDGVGTWVTPTFDSWDTQNGSPAVFGTPTTVTLLPGASAIFTTSYTIVAGDITGAGGTGAGATVDGDIDNSAVAEGIYPDGSPSGVDVTSPADTAEVPLDVTTEMTVAKLGYTDYGLPSQALVDGTSDNLEVGVEVTYVYVITNTGDVPIDDVSILDDHDGFGLFTNPDIETAVQTGTSGLSVNTNTLNNVYDTLGPGDILTVTTTYTIDQQDIDELQ